MCKAARSSLPHRLIDPLHVCTEMVGPKARSGLPRAAKITRSRSRSPGGRWPLLKNRPFHHWRSLALCPVNLVNLRFLWYSYDILLVPQFFGVANFRASKASSASMNQISSHVSMLLRLPWRYPHESKQQGSHPSAGTCCCKSKNRKMVDKMT